jgi:hypothetical protein
MWYHGWESNPHALRLRILSPLRLPFRHRGMLPEYQLIQGASTCQRPSCSTSFPGSLKPEALA